MRTHKILEAFCFAISSDQHVEIGEGGECTALEDTNLGTGPFYRWFHTS